MPNIRSAEKRVRQIRTRTARNRLLKKRIRAARRAFDEACSKGDKSAAAEAAKELSRAADTAAKRGTIHKNAASRFKSRASQKLAEIG